jgi:hypothetical protein
MPTQRASSRPPRVNVNVNANARLPAWRVDPETLEDRLISILLLLLACILAVLLALSKIHYVNTLTPLALSSTTAPVVFSAIRFSESVKWEENSIVVNLPSKEDVLSQHFVSRKPKPFSPFLSDVPNYPNSTSYTSICTLTNHNIPLFFLITLPVAILDALLIYAFFATCSMFIHSFEGVWEDTRFVSWLGPQRWRMIVQVAKKLQTYFGDAILEDGWI